MLRLKHLAVVLFCSVFAFAAWSQFELDGSTQTNAAAQESSTQKVTARKPALPSSESSAVQEAQKSLVSGDKFSQMLGGDIVVLRGNLDQMSRNWDVSYVPMLLEVSRYLPANQRALVMGLVESKTGNRFGTDFDKWMQWSWKQEFKQHPDYAKFKSSLYRNMDPRFAEYFVDTKDSKIRLDEIRWGGVRRDGIPPLANPKMLPANQATYLADSDVVFGIELNGDARAYPKTNFGLA